MNAVTTAAWAHLPNAAHIDRVLAHSAQHNDQWDAAWAAARDAARGAARGAAWDAAWDAAWGAARGAAWDAARGAAWDAVAAMVAWDDCAAYLTLPVDVVRHLSEDGIHAATLLLPVVIVFAHQENRHG